jgi:probable poly-beta-1,6-N-acetyl-D-glucosamine export protein
MSVTINRPGRPKITEIDVVRAFAIFAVVLIHATSEATYIPASGTLTQKFFYSINTFGAFAVPTFILLSGLVLFYRYFDNWKASDSLQFYRKRLISVVFPYLVFSAFYQVYYGFQNTRQLSFDAGTFLDNLPWGDASYHLYYMIIIFQFYLLFPLLISLAKSSRWAERGLAIFGIVVQIVYSFVTYGKMVPHGASLFITYFALFLIGASIGVHYAALSAWARRYWIALVAIALLVGATYVGLFWGNIYYKISIPLYWYTIVYNTFPVAVSIACIGFGKWLIETLPRLSKPVLRLGQMSFGVYLLHPAVLNAFKWFVPAPGNIMWFSIHTFAGLLVTLFGTWVLVEIYYKLKKLIFKGKGHRSPSVGKTA